MTSPLLTRFMLSMVSKILRAVSERGGSAGMPLPAAPVPKGVGRGLSAGKGVPTSLGVRTGRLARMDFGAGVLPATACLRRLNSAGSSTNMQRLQTAPIQAVIFIISKASSREDHRVKGKSYLTGS